MPSRACTGSVYLRFSVPEVVLPSFVYTSMFDDVSRRWLGWFRHRVLRLFVAFLMIVFFFFSDLQTAVLERMEKKEAILIGTGCKTRF